MQTSVKLQVTVSMLPIENQGEVWCIAEVGPRSTLTAMHYSTIPPEHFHSIKRAISSMHFGWMITVELLQSLTEATCHSALIVPQQVLFIPSGPTIGYE